LTLTESAGDDFTGGGIHQLVKAEKKDDAKDGDEDDDELSTDENESYAKVDIHLRETLRVVSDALALGKKPQFLANDHAPLTALSSKNG